MAALLLQINLWNIYKALAALPAPQAAGPDSQAAAERQCAYVAPVLPRPFGPSGVGRGEVETIWEDVWGYPLPAHQ